MKLWRDGELLLVRFVLKAADFGNWEAAARCSNWSEEQINALKKAAWRFGEPNTGNWRSRTGPLPITDALRVEAKFYRTGRWVLIDARLGSCITNATNSRFRGITIGDQVYGGIRNSTSLGFSYQPVRRWTVQ